MLEPDDSISFNIAIKLEDSVSCTITIEGRELTYWLCGNKAGLQGLTDDERQGTIAGIVAMKLCDGLHGILQGHLPDTESPRGECWEPWEKMDETTADQVYETVNRF